MESKVKQKQQIPAYMMVAPLFTLYSVSIAKPIFDILVHHPEYFVFNRFQNTGIYLFILTLSIVIPSCLSLFVVASGILGIRFRSIVQTTLISGLIGLLALQLAARVQFFPAALCVGAAATVAIGACILYIRNRDFSIALTLLVPLALVFPLLFLFNSDIQRVLHPKQVLSQSDIDSGAVWLDKSPPIIFVVFDEFSLVDVLDPQGNIDSKRFPNFAQLATESTWYANATAVETYTRYALPSILTGNHSELSSFPRSEDHPNNIFSLLKPHYSLNVIESRSLFYAPEENRASATDNRSEGISSLRILVEDMAVLYLHRILPADYTQKLPPIDMKWGGFVDHEVVDFRSDESPESEKTSFATNKEEIRQIKNAIMAKKDNTSARKKTINDFVESIDDYPASTFHFLHTDLPHVPARYLPSGKMYKGFGFPKGITLDEKTKTIFYGKKALVDRAHQDHLLQTGFVDSWVGLLRDKLIETGIYEESLVVITADHGAIYLPNVSRRHPDPLIPESYGGVAFVPLFIKYPGQREGVRDDTNVETIDIVPTIVDTLGAKVNWTFDGRSIIDPETPARSIKKLVSRGETFEYNEKQYLAAKQAAMEHNRITFSLDNPRADLFHYGPGLNWIGKPVSTLLTHQVPARITCPALPKIRNVDLNSEILWTYLTGKVVCRTDNPTSLFLVVSVNGVIQVIAKPYEHDGESLFDVVVPDSDFIHGENDVQLFLVREDIII